MATMRADHQNTIEPKPEWQSPASLAIQFPAIIKLYADDELLLINNLSTLQHEPHLQAMYFQAQDILVDATGRIFNIHHTDRLSLLKTGQLMPLDDVIKLVQAHLSQHGTVCISKFSAATIQEAFNCLS